jgi:hypothetical protein
MAAHARRRRSASGWRSSLAALKEYVENAA